MGHWENLYYEISESVEKTGRKKEFEALLSLISNSDEYKGMTTRYMWKSAYELLNNDA